MNSKDVQRARDRSWMFFRKHGALGMGGSDVVANQKAHDGLTAGSVFSGLYRRANENVLVLTTMDILERGGMEHKAETIERLVNAFGKEEAIAILSCTPLRALEVLATKANQEFKENEGKLMSEVDLKWNDLAMELSNALRDHPDAGVHLRRFDVYKPWVEVEMQPHGGEELPIDPIGMSVLTGAAEIKISIGDRFVDLDSGLSTFYTAETCIEIAQRAYLDAMQYAKEAGDSGLQELAASKYEAIAPNNP